MAETKTPEDGSGSVDERLSTTEEWMARTNEGVGAVGGERYLLVQRVQLLQQQNGTVRKTLGLIAFVCCLFAGACGDNPTSPTVVQLPDSGTKKSASAPTTPASSPAAEAGPAAALPAGITIVGPRAAVGDCLKASTLPAVLEWRISGVSASARIDRGYSHDAASGCGRTEADLRTQNDHLRYERDGTTLIVRFDVGTFTCGRGQVDISLDGVNVLGEVVNYGDDCTPPATPSEPPAPPVPPVVPPPPPQALWQTDLLCGGYGRQADGRPEDLTDDNYASYDARTIAWDAKSHPSFTSHEWCGDVHGLFDVVGNRAFITIDSPNPTVTLSLVTYRKNGVTNLPQAGYDGVTQTFTATGSYVMTVKVVE